MVSRMMVSAVWFGWMISLAVADQVDELLVQLKDPDPLVQSQAIEQLGQLKDKRAVEPLMALVLSESGAAAKPRVAANPNAVKVSDPAVEKVEKAKRAVAGGDKHTPPTMTTDTVKFKRLVGAVRTANNVTKADAVRALGATKDKRAVDTLLPLLNEQDFGQVHQAVIEALGDIGDPKAVPVLIQIMQNDTFNNRAAAEALGKIGDPRAAAAMYNLIKSSPFYHTDLINALTHLGGVEAVGNLYKVTLLDDTVTKQDARKALESLGPEHGLEPLTALLKDADPRVRSLAAEALSGIGDPVANDALEEAKAGLDEKTRQALEQKLAQSQLQQATSGYDASMQSSVRLAAIEALGQIADPRAARALLAALDDKEETVCKAAGKALAAYKTKTVIRPLEVNLSNTDHEVAKKAIRNLGYIGSDYAVQLLAGLLNGSATDPFIVKQAVESLGETNNPLAIPPLEKAMQDQFRQDDAVEALTQINHPDAVKPLLKGLSSNSFVTRQKTVEALGKFNNPAIVGPLLELVKKNDDVVMDRVLEILKKYDNPEIGAAFAEQLTDPKNSDKVLALLKERNWQPQTLREKVLYYTADKQWEQCKTLGAPAADIMLEEIKKSCSPNMALALGKMKDRRALQPILDCLKTWRAGPGHIETLKGFGWQPSSSEDKIQTAMATGDSVKLAELLKDPKAKEYLVGVMNSTDMALRLRIINTSVMCRLVEMVNPMVACLGSTNDERVAGSICDIFLRSRNATLSEAGKNWAISKGYRLIEFKTFGGDSW